MLKTTCTPNTVIYLLAFLHSHIMQHPRAELWMTRSNKLIFTTWLHLPISERFSG